MRGVRDKPSLLPYHLVHALQQAVDGRHERIQFAWEVAKRQGRHVICSPCVELVRQPDHGPKRSGNDKGDHQHQARDQHCDRKHGAERHVTCDLIPDPRALGHGKPAAVGSRPQHHPNRLSLSRCIAHPILKPPQLALLGCALRRPAQLHQPDLGVFIDPLEVLSSGEATALNEARDLDQHGVLRLDRFIECPPVCEDASDEAGHQHDRRQADEQSAAQRVDHGARSTIHPIPRTLRIASVPSFFRMVWIRNSTALLSTSSFQP